MSVIDIKPLRKVGADVGINSIEATVEFRVVCDQLNDGPSTVLFEFPLGRHIGGYANLLRDETVEGSPPHYYSYPFPREHCTDNTQTWLAEDGMGSWDTALYISNVRIIGREKIDREWGQCTWLVEVTYSRSGNHGPGYSIREITPYYIYEDEPQEYGAFLGLYGRQVSTRTPSDGPSQPGEFVKLTEDFYIEDTVFKGYVTEEDADEWQPLAICNTVGTPLETGSLVQRKARPAFKCEWFSYTALDFSDAIGKVNGNPYHLVSWDSSTQWPTNSFGGSGIDQPAVIFYRCFNPRELLVHSVDCEIVNWSGRKCYKYTCDLVYDRYGHDKYIANVGKEGKAAVGSDTPSGGKLEDGDIQSGMSPTQLLKGVDGTGPTSDVFLNYDGTPLVKYDGNGKVSRTTADALYMKWRVHEEVDFYQPWLTKNQSTGKLEFQFGLALIYQTGWDKDTDRSKCPLFYDGGWRYKDVSENSELYSPALSTWWDGVCRPPEPSNSESRWDRKNPNDK